MIEQKMPHTAIPNVLRLEAHLARRRHDERDEIPLQTRCEHQASAHRVNVRRRVLDLGCLLLERVRDNGAGLDDHPQQCAHLRLRVRQVGVRVDELENGVQARVAPAQDGVPVSGNDVALLERVDDVGRHSLG